MLQRLLPLAFLAVFFSACKNEDDTPAPAPPNTPYPGTADVYIEHPNSTTVAQNGFTEFSLHITSDNAVPQALTLSASGFPAGVSARFDPVSGTPPFNSLLHITADSTSTVGATTIVTLKATQANTATKTFEFAVSVDPQACGSSVAGTYTASDTVDGNAYTHPSTIVAEYGGRIRLSNFGSSVFYAYANLNCALNTVDIPYQLIDNTPFQGYGIFTSNSLILTGTFFFSSGINYSYRSTYRR